METRAFKKLIKKDKNGLIQSKEVAFEINALD